MSWAEVGWKRLLTDWVLDPQRRKQVLVRYVLELYLPAACCLAPWMGWRAFAAALPIPFATFLMYEFVLEWLCGRWHLVGSYWERQAAPGTTFVRG